MTYDNNLKTKEVNVNKFIYCLLFIVLTSCVPKPNSSVQQAVTDLPTQIFIPTKHLVEVTTTPALTIAPTNTPDPLSQGLRVDACGNDLCVYLNTSGNIPLGLGNNYNSFFGASWSPDGSRIVFAACPMANITNEKCHELFIVDQNGKNVISLTKNLTGHSTFTPVWSPNGEWIAFQDDGTLAIIRPDGTGRRRVIPFIKALGIDPSIWLPIAWSPDSKQIAMLISVRHTDTLIMDPPDRVWIVNRDGSESVRTILKSDLSITHLAWSPDGESVFVTLEDGKTYRIDLNCDSKPDGCNESSRTEIKEIPQDWLPSFHPQWLSAYTDPKAAVHGCGFSDKLLYADDFENANTANSIGFVGVDEAPGGGLALHILNVTDGVSNYSILDSAVKETRVNFRIMPINGAWGLRFRIGERDGQVASHGLYVNPGDTPLSLNLDMDPFYAVLGRGPRLLAREWSTIEMIRDDSNTIVVWLNNEEVIRYVDSKNLLVPSGGINVNVVGKDAEVWYDDFVICGQ